MPARTLDRLPERGLRVCCISPGAGIVGSLSEKLFKRLERRRSIDGLFLTGEAEAEVGERRPALIVAAAWREDKEGERGDGGPGGDTMPSVFAREMRRGRWGREELEGWEARRAWMVLMSGDIVAGRGEVRE